MFIRGDGLRGDILYPLNELKLKHPDLYELHLAKYGGREQVLAQRFPCLDCGWSDVVFSCPVHPNKVCAAMAKYRRRFVPSFPYREIPVTDLDPKNLAIWPFRNESFDSGEVIPFDYDLLSEMQEVPEASTVYFNEQWKKQEPALFFMYIPHVIHKGSIDMRNYPIEHTRAREPVEF